MAYQSEAQLEEQLIEQLKNQNYNVVSLPDYDALLANFKEQFEAFNAVNLNGKALSAKEWERVLNYQPKSGTRLAYEYAIRKSQDSAKIVINTYISDN